MASLAPPQPGARGGSPPPPAPLATPLERGQLFIDQSTKQERSINFAQNCHTGMRQLQAAAAHQIFQGVQTSAIYIQSTDVWKPSKAKTWRVAPNPCLNVARLSIRYLLCCEAGMSIEISTSYIYLSLFPDFKFNCSDPGRSVCATSTNSFSSRPTYAWKAWLVRFYLARMFSFCVFLITFFFHGNDVWIFYF